MWKNKENLKSIQGRRQVGANKHHTQSNSHTISNYCGFLTRNHNITFIIFLPKTHSLILTIRKHQPYPNREKSPHSFHPKIHRHVVKSNKSLLFKKKSWLDILFLFWQIHKREENKLNTIPRHPRVKIGLYF